MLSELNLFTTFFFASVFLLGIVIGSFWAIKAEELPNEIDLRRTHYSSKAHEE